MAQAVERMPSKCKALSSNPSTIKQTNKKRLSVLASGGLESGEKIKTGKWHFPNKILENCLMPFTTCE
jgi:hypothetical protein